jgi:hypothetical protein
MIAEAPTRGTTAAVEPALLRAVGRPDERLIAGLGRTLVGEVLAVLIVRGAELLGGRK